MKYAGAIANRYSSDSPPGSRVPDTIYQSCKIQAEARNLLKNSNNCREPASVTPGANNWSQHACTASVHARGGMMFASLVADL